MIKHLFTSFLFFIATVSVAFAEFDADNQAIVKGNILSSDGKPVPYVTVSLVDTKTSVFADENGAFEILNIKPGEYQLEVSATGMKAKRQSLSLQAGQAIKLSIRMDENANELENVVVNARRTLNQQVVSVGKAGIAAMDMPQSIAVVDAKMLKEQQAQRLSDAIRNVNGVIMADQRASTQEAFYARGYNLGSGNYFKNGSRINSGSFPEMSSLESVEVLKGSAAILYGNVAPGGIINMVTKKPTFNFGGEVTLRAGSYGLLKPAVDVYGPLSKNIAYRLNATYETADSYRDQVSSDRFYVNPSFLFKLGEKTELIVEGDYLYHNFTPDFGIGSLDNNIVTPVSRNTFFGTDWQYAKVNQASGSASLRHSFNDNWKLNVNASYQGYSRDYYSAERIQGKANGDWARPLGKTLTAQNYAVATVDLTGNFNTGKVGHKLLAGIDADYYQDKSTRFNQPSVYDTINLLDAGKFTPRTDVPSAEKTYMTIAPTNRFGAYVQDLISITPKLKLLAGIRWSIQGASVADTVFYPQKNKSNGIGDNKVNNAFSPRVGLVYKPFNNTSFFASYSNSFIVNNGIDIYGDPLDPSIVDQYELGVKNDLINGKLSVNVTAYRIVNNNLAQTAPFMADGTPNNNTSFKQLTGQTTSDGIEFDVMAYPVKGLHLTAGYAWNYMRYTKTPETKGSYIEGERLVNAPEHTANLTAFYIFQEGALNRLKLGAGVYYTGKRIGGWNNTKDQSQTYDRRIPVEGFATVDVSAGYSIKNWSLMLKVSNLTNTFNYYVHENYSINPIPPTQLIGTLAYRF